MSVTSIEQLIKSRTSANNYDKSHKLSSDEIFQLIKLATYSPSGFNLQNWNFIAVQTDEGHITRPEFLVPWLQYA